MGPEKRLSGLVSIDAAGAVVKSLPTPPERFRWTNTPGTRRLKVQFDGDWLSLRSRTRTERTKTLSSDAKRAESRRRSTRCRLSDARRARDRGAQRCADVGTADRLVGSREASSASPLGTCLISSALHLSVPRPSILTE
jgi:hypothetical protein